MTAIARRREAYRLGALATVLVAATAATAALAVVSDGNVAVVIAPAAAAALVYAVVRLPLRYSVLCFLFISLLLHNPGGRPHADGWRGPLYAAGAVYYDNLRNFVGIDALRFCLFEVCLALFLIVAVLRLLGPPPRPGELLEEPRYPFALPLKVALLATLVTIFALIGYGISRGGDFRQMLWQVRQIGWLPIIAALFALALKDQKNLIRLAGVLFAVALLRSLDGLYFYFAIAQPRGLHLPYILTHEDSVLFTVVFTILIAAVLEKLSFGTVALALVLTPVVGLALILNERRLAYVALFGALVAVVTLVRRPVRRAVLLILLALSPFLVAYVMVGWNSTAMVFRPIASLRSVGEAENLSNYTRDIENHNLAYTTSQHPILGSGFGHPYIEREKGPSIARFMENYLYIAHNSVLWLWSLGGLVGFTLMWLPMSIAVFLAVRSYRRSTDAMQRVAMLASIGTIIAYMTQEYGDMGATSWMAALLLAAAFAAIGNTATLTGAWRGRAGGGEPSDGK